MHPYYSVYLTHSLFSPTLCLNLFSMSASPLLLCEQVYQYHPSRFHIYMHQYTVLVFLVLTFFFFFLILFLIYLFIFTILYWFCHTLTWIHHGCTRVPHPEPPSHLNNLNFKSSGRRIPVGSRMCGRKQHLRKGENATYGKGDANTFLYSPMFYSILSTALPFCCSFAQTYLTLCGPMDCSMPGFPVLHHLLELAQTHGHWVGDAIQPSHPLSSPFPLALNLSQHQGLF